jgi:hypothetical protein
MVACGSYVAESEGQGGQLKASISDVNADTSSSQIKVGYVVSNSSSTRVEVEAAAKVTKEPEGSEVSIGERTKTTILQEGEEVTEYITVASKGDLEGGRNYRVCVNIKNLEER